MPKRLGCEPAPHTADRSKPRDTTRVYHMAGNGSCTEYRRDDIAPPPVAKILPVLTLETAENAALFSEVGYHPGFPECLHKS